MPWKEVLSIITTAPTELDHSKSLLSTPEFPLSRFGTLYLAAAKAAGTLLYDRKIAFTMDIFDDHQKIAQGFTGTNGDNSGKTSVVDSILILGWAALDANEGFEDPKSDDDFNQYLLCLSVISANTPFSDLRYQAHSLNTTLLYTHRSSQARFNYIHDVLEHCPFENLQVSAVGWLKDQILEAFDPSIGRGKSKSEFRKVPESSGASNVFAIPKTLHSVACILFAAPSFKDEQEIIVRFPFWLAVLNFYFMLCSSRVLYTALEVSKFGESGAIGDVFLDNIGIMITSSKDPMSVLHTAFEDSSGLKFQILEDGYIRTREAHANILDSRDE